MQRAFLRWAEENNVIDMTDVDDIIELHIYVGL